MVDKVRLPEPTAIKSSRNGEQLVSEERLREYIHQLLRVLRFNLSDINSSLIALESHKTSITKLTTTGTLNYNTQQWNCNTDSAAFTVTLPTGVQGGTFKIVNVGTSGNDLTIAPAGSELLFGLNTTFLLTDGESLVISYDETDGWY